MAARNIYLSSQNSVFPNILHCNGHKFIRFFSWIYVLVVKDSQNLTFKMIHGSHFRKMAARNIYLSSQILCYLIFLGCNGHKIVIFPPKLCFCLTFYDHPVSKQVSIFECCPAYLISWLRLLWVSLLHTMSRVYWGMAA